MGAESSSSFPIAREAVGRLRQKAGTRKPVGNRHWSNRQGVEHDATGQSEQAPRHKGGAGGGFKCLSARYTKPAVSSLTS